jgi:hypothetical protein
MPSVTSPFIRATTVTIEYGERPINISTGVTFLEYFLSSIFSDIIFNIFLLRFNQPQSYRYAIIDDENQIPSD